MNPICDICGREMEWDQESLLGSGSPWKCPASPDQHKIAALEKELAELRSKYESA